MVIAPARDGIGPFVLLADGEFLPEKFNNEKVVVMRCGPSTGNRPVTLKAFGQVTPLELLRPPVEPECTYQNTDGNPLHEHKDGTWWFYEETWALESGPYESFDDGYTALEAYCITLQAVKESETKDLTESTENDNVESDEGRHAGVQKDSEGDGSSSD